MKRIHSSIIKHRDLLIYLIFGVLTTLVNFFVFFPLYNWAKISALLSNVIAWIASVLFAFVTNKSFVFRSNDWSRPVVMAEVTKFVGGRVASGILETSAIWLFVDCMKWNGNWIKVIVSFFVVVLNYIFSKWIVFSKKEKS